ncbi:MAG: cytochrome c [Deltaproteobacteria bacterium]|nr:cytochrome c [Deltaproteobacteria bacterium]
MPHFYSRILLLAIACTATACGGKSDPAQAATDDDDPRHVRHELMEGVRDAAKPVGAMLKGEAEFDADTLMSSLKVFHDASGEFGDLFPPGTETGMDTEAAPAIWEDREGFDQALADWRAAVEKAMDAKPATLEDAKPVVGPIFNTCKNCHDTYRIEEEG